MPVQIAVIIRDDFLSEKKEGISLPECLFILSTLVFLLGFFRISVYLSIWN